MSESIGKKAETKIQEWLDRPSEGYSFDRIKDQMTQLDFSAVQTYVILLSSNHLTCITQSQKLQKRTDLNSA